MIRLSLLLPVLAFGLAVATPPPARAEHPLEKLHKKLFGDDDRRKDDDKKKKDKDKDKDRDKIGSTTTMIDATTIGMTTADMTIGGTMTGDTTIAASMTVVRIIRRRSRSSAAFTWSPLRVPMPRDPSRLRSSWRSVAKASITGRLTAKSDLARARRFGITEYARQLPVTGRIDTYLVRSLGL